jgi:hypothetical protein
MMLPPALLRVCVQSDESRRRLWIPVFLLWPLLAFMAALAMPVCALIAALYWRGGLGRPILFAVPCLLYLLCSLRGLRFDVAGGGSRLFISID